MILPKTGELRRQRMLASEATYEILDMELDHVVVRVIEAPGLEDGMRVRLTLAAVVQMELVTSWSQAAGASPAQLGGLSAASGL